jgi:hypothetical protein
MTDFSITPGYSGPKVKGKLGSQRKPQEYVIQPCSDGQIIVQGDSAIGKFDPDTREGVLNIKGSYFIHLSSAMLGAKKYTFPEEFVTLVKQVCPAPGSETSRGGVTIVNTVQVI